MKIRIEWQNEQDAVLDSDTINVKDDQSDEGGRAIREAIIALMGNGIVSVGDKFIVSEVE